MPKNKKKGKHTAEKEKRALVTRDPMQEYAKILKMLGDRKVTMVFPDSREVLGLIPGRFRKRVWMAQGDIVLVSVREFQDDRYDIVLKYTPEEVHKLVKKNEIPEFFLDGLSTTAEDNNGINFGEEEDPENEFDFDDI